MRPTTLWRAICFTQVHWFKCSVQFSSVQFSRSVVSDSLRPHELQHARPPCPSPTPRVHSNTSIESVMPSSYLILCRPLCLLCRPLLLLPPIPPSIRVFSNGSTLCMRWPKYWSFSFSISLPKNTQDWSPLEWTGWISLQSKGLSRVFSNTTVQKHQFLGTQLNAPQWELVVPGKGFERFIVVTVTGNLEIQISTIAVWSWTSSTPSLGFRLLLKTIKQWNRVGLR